MPMFNLGSPYISDVDANGTPITFKAPKSSPFVGVADPTYPTVPDPGIGPTTTRTAAPRISFGGFTPNYKALIEADPGLMAVRAGNVKGVEDAASARKAALRMLAVKYGGLPAGFKDQYGDIDQSTLDQAGQNQFSDEANLSRNYQQTLEGFRRSLAARNMLQSSELDYGQNQADISRGQQEYDLGNQFGAAAQSAVNTFTGYEGQARQQEAQAIGDASSRVYSQPGNQPTGATTATLVGDWQTKYGQPVYDDGTGKLYDENGNLFSPPSTSSAPAPTDTTSTPGPGTTSTTPTDTSAAPAPDPTLPPIYQPGTILQPGTAYVDQTDFGTAPAPAPTDSSPAPAPTYTTTPLPTEYQPGTILQPGTAYVDPSTTAAPTPAPAPAPEPAPAPTDNYVYWLNPLTGQIEVHPPGWVPPTGTAGMQ